MIDTMTVAPVYLMRGDDPSLVRDAVRTLIDQLVGDGDRTLMVEDLDGDEYPIGALVDAAQTPPFLTERRVVIGRGAHRFSTVDAVAPLLGYLADPLPTTVLVLVWESGRVPKPLLDAVKAAGGQHLDTSPGYNAKAQRQWLADHLRASGLRLDNAAQELVVSQLGEDVGRLTSILATLTGTYGEGASLTDDDIRPYLGEAGSMAPWELTDAIDQGRIEKALDRLHRLIGAGGRHPLPVLYTLMTHYSRMLALDGSGATNEKDAAAVLGIKGSTFPARKALDQARRLGYHRISTAVKLLAQADLDLRGAKGWPDNLVMEVLVARLANLSAAAR